MDHVLKTAYRAALYRVLAPAGELLLKVDQPSPGLADLLREAGADQAALLTAFNPHSQIQTAGWNRTAQARLLAQLAAEGYRPLPACNGDPAGRWPVEHSVLVPGMDLPAARRIAARYQQVAFLWIDARGTPRLVETRAGIG